MITITSYISESTTYAHRASNHEPNFRFIVQRIKIESINIDDEVNSLAFPVRQN